MAQMISNANGAYKVTIGNTQGVRLSKAAYVQQGYGQVEPNLLTGQITGQLHAQLPVVNTITQLENGQFLKYDYANQVCNLEGPGEWMLVFNEVKVYRDYDTDADFAMLPTNYSASIYNAQGLAMPSAGSNMVPRLMRTYVGDIYTTNTVDATELEVKDVLTVDPRSGLLVKISGFNESVPAPGTVGKGDTVLNAAELQGNEMQWQVVKVYTLGDLQPAVKLMRIQ